jgi:hypothetical protein
VDRYRCDEISSVRCGGKIDERKESPGPTATVFRFVGASRISVTVAPALLPLLSRHFLPKENHLTLCLHYSQMFECLSCYYSQKLPEDLALTRDSCKRAT